MKIQILIIFLIVGISFPSKSQAPWPETGTKWWYFGGDPLYGPRQMILEAVGEEVFEGRLSQKINRTDVDYVGNAVLNGEYYAYIQNDSVFVFNDVWEEYLLVFDYTAEVGDTIIFKNAVNNSGPDSLVFAHVVRIDSTKFCEDVFKAKTWSLEHKLGFASYQEVFMQRSFIHPFDISTWYAIDDGDKFLRCFENGTFDFDCSDIEEESCYGKPSTVEEQQGLIRHVSLFPNPAINRIWLDIPGNLNKLDYVITDAIGKEVATGQIDSLHQVIEIGFLRAGLYILHFPGAKIQASKFTISP